MLRWIKPCTPVVARLQAGMDHDLQSIFALATSAGIGLLVGLERERNPRAKAGLRTFALIAVLGTLSMMLSQALSSGWILAAALLVVGGTVAGAHFMDPETKVDASGTTTVIAAAVVFALGAMIALGERQLAVGLGVGVTVLLYFKTELEGFSHRLTTQDLSSMLRFAVLSAVILPLLPDRPFAESGPLHALNLFNLWLMVVLISGVSLSGYVAWRLTLGRHGLLVTGVVGGLASSTATTLVAAREVRDRTHPPAVAQMIILLANSTMFVRVMLVVALVSPAVAPSVATAMGPALLLALPAIAWHWRTVAEATHVSPDEYKNPTNLVTAVAFGAGYALILVLAAMAAQHIGTEGVYGLALVSGLTDVDAITLSMLQLASTGALTEKAAATAIALAVGSNLVLKTAIVFFAGGRQLGLQTALAFVPPLAGIAAGIALLRLS